MERDTRNIKLGIGIPTYNRYDLLQSSLLLYARDFGLDSPVPTPFYIIDNGKQGVSFNYGKVYVPENNIGVGASWNFLCEKIFEKCDYALILNDDIYLGKKRHDIIEMITKKPNKFMRATPDWCAFIIPKVVYETVGAFDECFYPAYYEDRSYEYRMKLLGVPVIKTPLLNPYEYRSSQSMEKEPSIFDYAKKNKRLYIEMWGGEPEREKYKTPFGNNNS